MKLEQKTGTHVNTGMFLKHDLETTYTALGRLPRDICTGFMCVKAMKAPYALFCSSKMPKTEVPRQFLCT